MADEKTKLHNDSVMWNAETEEEYGRLVHEKFLEYTAKTTPHDDDTLIMNDSEDEGAIKRVKVSDLPGVTAPATNTEDENYTLALTDAGKLILAGHASNAVKITIPLDAVEFPVNTEIAIYKLLAGDLTIGTADGATLEGEAHTTTFTINSSAAIKKIASNTWIMAGDFEEDE